MNSETGGERERGGREKEKREERGREREREEGRRAVLAAPC